jgi:hypothetical protein
MSNLPVNLDKFSEIPGTVGSALPPAQLWTPTLQIIYGLSQLLKNWTAEDGPKPEPGDFWLGQKNGTNLGKSFITIPIAHRDHALSRNLKSGEVLGESYNGCPQCMSEEKVSTPHSPETEEQKVFHQIANDPKQVNTPKGTILNNWGSDVLLWIPKLKTFTTMFLHSTNRQCIKTQYVPNEGKFCKVRAYSPPSSQFTWYLAECREVKDVSTLDPSTETFLPTETAMFDEVTKFKNPAPRIKEEATGVDGRPR